MIKLNIESIGADWCIDDIIKAILDNNHGLFIASMITIPENKLPHLKGTLTINNTTVNLSEAYSFSRVGKISSSREISSGSEIYYECGFVGNELPIIVIILDSSFKPIHALIDNGFNPVLPPQPLA